MRNILFSIFLSIFCISLTAQIYSYADNNPIELGKVKWIRNYDEALNKAETLDKPIFILFQEVPGCGNCTKYGQEILSHPLIVEAIEDEYIPLAIYNNKEGHDREVLDHFGEPTWNNPVVRIVNQEGAQIAPRIADFRSTSALLNAMTSALKKAKKETPLYLSLLEEEFTAEEKGNNEFYLSMYCFWTGEKEIAQIDGVVGTEAGFMHGKEVVKIKYNTSETNIKKISYQAAKVNCGDQVFTDANSNLKLPQKKIGKYKKDHQDKYYLLHSPLRHVPMTSLQKAKVNSALGSKKDPTPYLSPRQLKLLEKNRSNKNYIGEEFVKSWYSAVKV